MDHERSQAEQPQTSAEEIEASTEAKESFVGHIGHELKAPLTTILTGSRLLLRYDDLQKEERTEILTDIALSAEQLSDIVDNMLALTRLEHGAGLQKEELALAPLIEAAVEEFLTLHVGREVVSKLDDRPQVFKVNPGLLVQVVKNLLDNADKYSPEGEPIEVQFEVEEDGASFTVEDCGPGIRETESRQLFEPFYRASSVSGMEGTGIGLSVCQQIIDVHGGEIWLRNREGGGSQAGFRLPAEA